MDYTVKTNIIRANTANRNHLQQIQRMMGRSRAQQWFQIYYSLLTDTSCFLYARIRDGTEGTEVPLAKL